MTGGQMMVVLIVTIVMIASVIKSKHGHGNRHRHRHGNSDSETLIDSGETVRLREEVARLKDRVIVLERIATDKNHLLEQEFDRLRNS